MNTRVVTFGEPLLRLSTPGYLRFSQVQSFNASYGGAEANVSVSLARFGVEVEYVTRLPKNEIGEACLEFLRKQGIGLHHVVRGGDRLGIYYCETGAAQRSSLVVYDRANSSIATLTGEMLDWKKVFQDAGWFHFTGITPALSQSVAEACLEAVKTAREMGLVVSCDLNYRSKLWKWGKEAAEVMPNLLDYCDMVIGNEEDADKVLGIKAAGTNITTGLLNAERYLPVCQEIANRFKNLSSIAITLRGSLSASHNTWSALLWHKDKTYTGPSYDILPVIDRVGGGDAFTAGLIYGMLHFNEDYQKALDFAVAASCLKHSIPDDLNLVTLAEVEKLMQGDASGRVAR